MDEKISSEVERFVKEKSFEFGELLYSLNVPRINCVKHTPMGLSTIYVVFGWNHAHEIKKMNSV